MFLQGQIDNEGSLQARFNYRIGSTKRSTIKTQFQTSPSGSTGQDTAQVEHEYLGNDFTASIKALNPSYLDGGLTGIFIGQYLQAVTPKLSVGLEAVWQRAGLSQGPDTAVSCVARYKGSDWAAACQLQPAQGSMNTSFWKKLSEKVQAGADMSLALVPGAGGLMGGFQKEGVTTVGVKYDFRMSTLRAQLDSRGKLGCYLEKRMGAPVMVQMGLDVDHSTVRDILVIFGVFPAG